MTAAQPSLSAKERQIRLRLRDDFEHYAAKVLKIRTKAGSIEPLRLNRAQQYIHERIEEQRQRTGRVRALILKGRQQGASTLVEARFYWRVTHRSGVRAFILTHDAESTAALFEMAQRYHELCHPLVKPSTGASSAKELVFDRLDSAYKVGTAGNKGVGRGTTIQYMHASEVAFWPHASEHAKGILQAVPDEEGTEVILESTANGVGNYFHEQWQLAEAGDTDFIPIFVPWYWQPEYRSTPPADWEANELEHALAEAYGLDAEQLAWRRRKVSELSVGGTDGEAAFRQEYPLCVAAGTRVGTQRGIIPVESIVAGDITAFGEVTRAWCSGRKAAVRVETARGYSVTCTPDHRFLCGDGEWREAGAMLGEDVALSAPAASASYAEVAWHPLPGVQSRVVIDEGWGRLIGYFMGDGSFYKSTVSIVCDAQDEDSIEDICGLLAAKLGHPSRRVVGSKGGGVEIRKASALFAPVLENLGLIRSEDDDRHGPRRKVCVPEVVFNSPEGVIREFLRGLFDADGFIGVGTPRVSLFSKHRHLLQQVQVLLLVFGIPSRIKEAPAKNGSGYKYVARTLNVHGKAAVRFMEEVGVVSGRKSARAALWRGVGAPRVRRPMSEICLFDTVTAVSPVGDVDVYDLSIPGQERFDANGVVVHNCATEAFAVSGTDSLINPESVAKARVRKVLGSGPLIIGVDPARYGDDSTAIIRRKGRAAYKLETYRKRSTMEVAGIVHSIIKSEKPAQVAIDVGGLGAGVVDRLLELGHEEVVVPINFGSSALDPNVYVNRRAEMWYLMRDWLDGDMPVMVPDDDALHSDLCAVRYIYDSNSRRKIESKEAMRKRGIRSPDSADALALTLAEPVKAPKAARYQTHRGVPAVADSVAGY